VSADDDRHAAGLHGLGIRLERLPRVVIALERVRPGLPQRAQRRARLLGARDALVERNAERAELVLHPADADAEQRAALREHVERRDSFAT
jgi:hypothetical protein